MCSVVFIFDFLALFGTAANPCVMPFDIGSALQAQLRSGLRGHICSFSGPEHHWNLSGSFITDPLVL